MDARLAALCLWFVCASAAAFDHSAWDQLVRPHVVVLDAGKASQVRYTAIDRAHLGRRASLDWIEHDTLRKQYPDPRLHFALNCASIGCPMLREEACVAARLEAQLDEQASRFLSDRSRNRYRDGRLEVSRIFEWYKDDFAPRERWFARHAALLGASAEAVGQARLAFLEYDWALNDFRSSSPR